MILYSMSLNGSNIGIKIHTLSDSSGYYVIGRNGSGVSSICKYILTSSTSALCQQIANLNSFSYGQLKISDTEYFVLNYNSADYSLYFFKFTFSMTRVDWANKMLWSSGVWLL